jgi:hypothetical protein
MDYFLARPEKKLRPAVVLVRHPVVVHIDDEIPSLH